MRRQGRGWLLPVCLIAALAGVGQAGAVTDNSPGNHTQELSIPAQPLPAALLELAEQARLQLVYDANLVPNQPAPSLIGAYTLARAFEILLADTGLYTRFQGHRRVQLASDPAPVQPLPTLVVSASGYEQSLQQAPAAITVIDREQLMNRPFRSLQDALTGIPGVSIAGGRHQEGSGLSIRGMESDQTLILVDGRRISSAEANPRGGGNDLESHWVPPVAAIERIEVIRGPMSSLYGADAVGGVINVITRAVASNWSTSLVLGHTSALVGQQGNAHQGSAYVSGPLLPGRLGLQLWGSQQQRQEDAFKNGAQQGRQRQLTGRLWLETSDHQRWMLELGQARQHYARHANASGAGQDRRRHYRRRSWALAHQGQWQTLDTRLQLYREHTSRQAPLFQRYLPTSVTHTIADGQLTAYFRSHTTTLGYQWQDTTSSKADFRNLQVPDSLWGTRSVNQQAWFVEDEWRFAPRFTLTTGVRLSDHQIYGLHWSPRSYLNWRPAPHWTLKGGIGTGFKAPQLREMDASSGAPQARGAILALGNPELSPEQSVNTELGVYYQRPGLNVSATAFHSDFRNKIINTASHRFRDSDGHPIAVPALTCQPSDPATRDCPAWGTWLNLPGARVQGLELQGHWSPDQRLTASLSYTYTDSRLRSGRLHVTTPAGERLPFQPANVLALAGEPLAAVPAHQAWLKLAGPLSEHHPLRGHVQASYQSDVAAVSFGQGNQVRVQPASLTTVDLGLSWSPSSAVTVNAGLDNLFDQRRFRLDRVDDPRRYQYPDPGRRLWLGLTAEF